jgi:hypothetical protein
MPEMKTYTGGCHCGEVRFEVQTDLAQVVTCNCSICSKKGLLLIFVPADRFSLRGEDALTEYRFNRHSIRHLFCAKCGTQSFARGIAPSSQTETIAVNVRCLDDVDVGALAPTPFDGRSL